MPKKLDYQIRKPEAREILPAINLLPKIPHKGKKLDMHLFGQYSYKTNVQNMQKAYFHSKELPNITFRPATTSESISSAAYGFGGKGEFDAKRDVFDPRWLQLGYILKTSEGVFVNAFDFNGDMIINEKYLKSLLEADKKVNGIYLLHNE